MRRCGWRRLRWKTRTQINGMAGLGQMRFHYHRRRWYTETMNDATLHDFIPTTAAERQAERQRWEELRERLESRYTADAVRDALQSREAVAPEPALSSAARALSKQLEEEALTATGRG